MSWPFTSLAQPVTLPVIGFLNGGSPDGYAPMLSAFHRGLKETGYVEGQNVAIEYRWANGEYDHLSALVGDLVRREVLVIAATSTPANLVAKASTTKISDRLHDRQRSGTARTCRKSGSTRRQCHWRDPNDRGGGAETARVSSRVGPQGHRFWPTHQSEKPVCRDRETNSLAAAAKLGLQLNVLQASTEAEVDDAFKAFRQMQAGALILGTDAFFNNHLEQLAAKAISNSIILIYEYHQFVQAGGLASYGGSITESYRLAGVYVGRILRGEKPADLPVQQATKIELLINLKTAKALGITVPQSVQNRADEIIE